MKKLCSILLCLFVLTGCSGSNDNKGSNTTYHYNDDFYTIKSPYKKSKSENYIVNSNVVSFDLETIEKGLIQLSTNEYSINKYILEDGQYLTKKDLIDLLDNINKHDEIEVSGHKIKPTIINGIIEKDFYIKNNLSGLSIGIIVNRYQTYDNSGNYVTLDEDMVIDYAKDKSTDIIKYIRDTYNLKNINILVGIYLENNPNSNVRGDYIYYGITNTNDIEFNNINNKRYYMNNPKVKEMDDKNYNNYIKFEKEIKEFDNTISMSGLAYYYDSNLNKLDIIITKSNYNYGELLYFTQLTSNSVIKYFDNINVTVEINSINDKKAYIVKQERESKTDIFIY